MPTEIIQLPNYMYCCDYCNELFNTKHQATIHEKNCKYKIKEHDELESSDNQ